MEGGDGRGVGENDLREGWMRMGDGRWRNGYRPSLKCSLMSWRGGFFLADAGHVQKSYEACIF